jgi:long-chain fatty acid transport protein
MSATHTAPKRYFFPACSLLSALLFVPRSAEAAGFATSRFGGEHGSVVTTNPTALFYNPSGIAFSEGTHLFADGSLALRRTTWDHPPGPTEPAEPTGAEGANYGRATLLNVFGAPMLGATTKLNERLAIGAAFFVPFGGRASWDTNEKFENHPQYPLAEDGVQRWHTIEGALTFMYFSVGAALKLGPLSVGVSGNLVRSSVESYKARTLVGEGDPDIDSEGRARLDVSGWQGGFGVGGTLEVLPNRLWIGASYQAQPGLGPMQLSGTLEVRYQGDKNTYPVTFDTALPDSYRLGARYRPTPTIELRLFGDVTRWSVLQTQCIALEGKLCVVDRTGADVGGGTILNIRRYWKDTFGVRASASHWLKPELELFGGLGFETAAVPDSTLDPELFDSETISGAFGGRFEVIPSLFIAGSYTHIQYLSRNNIRQSTLALPASPTRRADGGGKYTQWIGLFNLNVEKTF